MSWWCCPSHRSFSTSTASTKRLFRNVVLPSDRQRFARDVRYRDIDIPRYAACRRIVVAPQAAAPRRKSPPVGKVARAFVRDQQICVVRRRVCARLTDRLSFENEVAATKCFRDAGIAARVRYETNRAVNWPACGRCTGRVGRFRPIVKSQRNSVSRCEFDTQGGPHRNDLSPSDTTTISTRQRRVRTSIMLASQSSSRKMRASTGRVSRIPARRCLGMLSPPMTGSNRDNQTHHRRKTGRQMRSIQSAVKMQVMRP
jgi:hypothetical protein